MFFFFYQTFFQGQWFKKFEIALEEKQGLQRKLSLKNVQ